MLSTTDGMLRQYVILTLQVPSFSGLIIIILQIGQYWEAFPTLIWIGVLGPHLMGVILFVLQAKSIVPYYAMFVPLIISHSILAVVFTVLAVNNPPSRTPLGFTVFLIRMYIPIRFSTSPINGL
jgi:hypothetical protein